MMQTDPQTAGPYMMKMDGPLTVVQRNALRPLVDSCAAYERIELDLRDVTQADSTGLILMRMLQMNCMDAGVPLAIQVTDGQGVADLLDLVGVEHSCSD
jgi:ABC-type transporter Mla MlaB component